MNNIDEKTMLTTTLKHRAYEKIKSMILSNQLCDENPITELKLSGILGIGRAPIREALNLLAKDGLIQLIPNKGAVLKKMTPHDLIQIYQIRQVLDPLATKLAIGKIPQKQFKNIEDSIQNGNSDWESGLQLSKDLHDLIYRSCGNPYLWEVYTSLALKIEVSRFFLWNMWSANSDRQAVERRKIEHAGILQALKENNPKDAEKLSKRHISNVFSEAKKWI